MIVKNGILVKIIQEIDELCDDWVPEPLTPQITEEMMVEPPTLERFLDCFFFPSIFLSPFLLPIYCLPMIDLMSL